MNRRAEKPRSMMQLMAEQMRALDQFQAGAMDLDTFRKENARIAREVRDFERALKEERRKARIEKRGRK